MRFYEVLDQMVALLRQRGQVTYRALKREFQLELNPQNTNAVGMLKKLER